MRSDAAPDGVPVRRSRRLGVIGTFVWDVIHGRDVRTAPVEEWGGIAYALGALDAALPARWEVVPIIKVGADLRARAVDFLGTLRRLAPDAALVEVPYPNNRVELRYHSSERRSEVLRGGVPVWARIPRPVRLAIGLAALWMAWLAVALWLGVRMGAAWYDRAQAETYQAVAAF